LLVKQKKFKNVSVNFFKNVLDKSSELDWILWDNKIFEFATNAEPEPRKKKNVDRRRRNTNSRTGRAWWDCLAQNQSPSAELSDGLTLTWLKQSERRQQQQVDMVDYFRRFPLVSFTSSGDAVDPTWLRPFLSSRCEKRRMLFSTCKMWSVRTGKGTFFLTLLSCESATE
jgi:hypothetical protein